MSDRLLADVNELLSRCEALIGYQFSDKLLLRRCLTHSSSAETRLDSNERLEFLGDAVLGLVICEHLFQLYPDQREGQLTQMKSQLVSRNVCARVARRLRLNETLLVGRGLNHLPESILSAVVESVIAGIYSDGGLEAARRFILFAFEDEFALSRPRDTENFKSLLQEFTQRDLNTTPDYQVLEERGPDHAREFRIAAKVGETIYEPAWGRSKKEAEQQAARRAMEMIAAGNATVTASDVGRVERGVSSEQIIPTTGAVVMAVEVELAKAGGPSTDSSVAASTDAALQKGSPASESPARDQITDPIGFRRVTADIPDSHFRGGP